METLDHLQIRMESVFVAAWVSDEALIPSRALRSVLVHYGEEYEGSPLALPLPSDAPSDLPSIVLPSQDGRSYLDISRSRLVLRWTRAGGPSVPLQDTVDIFA